MKSEDFSVDSFRTAKLSGSRFVSVLLLLLVSLGIVIIASSLIALTLEGSLPEGWIFGLAFLLLHPVIVAFFAPFTGLIGYIVSYLSPKRLSRAILCRLLESDVKRLRKTHTFTVVGVVGSVGKTSTKLAIAQTLVAAGLRVQSQTGNYNDRATVPLVFFGQQLPSLYNVFAWLRVLSKNKKIIKNEYPYDVVVVELGTDGPGQLQAFSYIQPELVVVTAVAPEHMEFFGSLEAVAEEELSVAHYAKKLLINTDDTAQKFIEDLKYISYGLSEVKKGYTAEITGSDSYGQQIAVFKDGQKYVDTSIAFLGTQGRKVALAAAAVADILGVESDTIATALTSAKPFSGRLQRLKGVKDTVLLDDTYNATPSAVEAALRVLEDLNAPQRIAVLGSMNELGDFGPEAHKTIGASIDSSKVDLVVTIGVLARDYLAPAAVAGGCRVVTFLNPHEAGMLVKTEITSGAVVLFKGSQNGVFAEEAIKPLLKNPKDAALLVRQSDYWMRIKRKQFKLPKHKD